MLFYTGLAVLNGIVNTINKLVNFEAKQRLGMANGTLINYLEGTLISLAIALFSGNLTDLPHLSNISPVYFTGGIFGLFSMLLILKGMVNTQMIYATALVLIGQLGAGFAIDSMAAGTINPLKILGIALVIAGVLFDQFSSLKSAAQPPDSTP
ncbi:DMT family transporter [Marasmitruncus massiliensis]|uniref:DMT family transporter n=1 Tax=Marasmitruncus massiliensis TaxID=1944642 RepID=UPI000C7AF8AB|nr:DMT family transporter [Marasmitruncus massiliensis]